MRKLLRWIVLLFMSAPLSAQELEIIHLNVGQGDATLILGPEQPDGKRVTVLIDAGDIPSGGDGDGGAVVDTVMRERGIDEIDFFIATHYDADHIGGVITGNRLLSTERASSWERTGCLVTTAMMTATRKSTSAICELRWQDVDLEQRPGGPYGALRWPEDTGQGGQGDNGGDRPRRAPRAPPPPCEAGGSGPADPVFPAPRSEGSISRHHADSLLRRTAEAARVELRDGEAWHSIRRKWVNERKHLPPTDVAEAGGWTNVETMMQVHTQTDSQTRLSVVLNGRDWTQSSGHTEEEGAQETA